MSEDKRFFCIDYIDYSIQCVEISDNGDWVTYGQIVDLLNEQHETIQQLKQAYSNAKFDVERYEQILKDIMKDILLIQDMKKELEND